MRLRVLALGLAALLAACSGGATTTASGNTIKIGLDFPLSGADASIGVATQNGALLAIEQANAHGFAGGKFTVVAYPLDDTVQGVHDAAQGAQNVKTFIADPDVLAIVGPYNSNVAKAEIPLGNDAGIAQVSPATTSDVLTLGDAAKALRSANPDRVAFYRVCANDSDQGAALAQYAAKLGFKKVFVIDDNETYGLDLSERFVADFTGHGGTILGHEHITRNQQDFKALLTKVRGFAPDAIFFGGTTSTGGGLLRRQMGDVGMAKVTFLGGDGIADPEFETTAGPMADGTYYTVAAADATRLASARAFIAAYKARFHEDIGGYSASAYAAAQVALAGIASAIAANGGKPPTRDAVLTAVGHTSNFATPIGNITFNGAGDTQNPTLTLQRVSAGGKVSTVDVFVMKS
jgi:branched-chain amino acid transport system substrate-binding protein